MRYPDGKPLTPVESAYLAAWEGTMEATEPFALALRRVCFEEMLAEAGNPEVGIAKQRAMRTPLKRLLRDVLG